MIAAEGFEADAQLPGEILAWGLTQRAKQPLYCASLLWMQNAHVRFGWLWGNGLMHPNYDWCACGGTASSFRKAHSSRSAGFCCAAPTSRMLRWYLGISWEWPADPRY